MMYMRRPGLLVLVTSLLACAASKQAASPPDAAAGDAAPATGGQGAAGGSGSGSGGGGGTLGSGGTAAGPGTGTGGGPLAGGTGGAGAGGSGGTAGAPASGGAGGGTTAASGGTGAGGGAGAMSSTGGRGGVGATGAGAGGGIAGGGGGTGPGTLPTRASILGALTLANNYFMGKWPDPGAPIVNPDRSRPSHIWTRGVYYEGLMALHAVDPQPRYYNYAVEWATSHAWGLNGGITTLSADNQCAGQTYIDLYLIDRQPERLRDIKANIDRTLALPHADWTWIDALQMSMPVYARLGALTGNNAYYTKMYNLYAYTKNSQGTAGLYNKADHLWWRDQDFDPPYLEPNGQDCYWSRGNGWVYAALVRVLDILPATESHRAEYLADYLAMTEALRAVQRSDGFWNVSLHDPTNFGGKETTGTALFTYGMAMGVRKGWLNDTVYRPIVTRAWNAMAANSVRPNGALGWVQGTGKQPSDNGNGMTQATTPVTATSVPDFEDYGLGCFLLAGSEMTRLAGN